MTVAGPHTLLLPVVFLLVNEGLGGCLHELLRSMQQQKLHEKVIAL